MIDRATRIIKKYLEYQKEIYSIFGLEEPQHEFNELGYEDYQLIRVMEGIPWKIKTDNNRNLNLEYEINGKLYWKPIDGWYLSDKKKNIFKHEKYTVVICGAKNDYTNEDTTILMILENSLEVKTDD